MYYLFLPGPDLGMVPANFMAPPSVLTDTSSFMEGEQTRPRYAKSLCPLNSALAPKPCRSSPEMRSRKEVKNERPSKHAQNQRSGNSCLSDCEVSRTSTRIKREFELESSTQKKSKEAPLQEELGVVSRALCLPRRGRNVIAC